MVSCDKILETAREKQADIIGLSGLITPSLDEMVHVAKEMKRQDFDIPLLIGGATTSAKHTAVKIAQHYNQPVVHVVDASLSVPVVENLLDADRKPGFIEKNIASQQRDRSNYEATQSNRKLVPYKETLERRFATNWKEVQIDVPSFLGTKILKDVPLSTLVPYIDWSPFFMTWELKGKYPKIFSDAEVGTQAKHLFDDAQKLLQRIVDERLLKASGVYGFWPAASDGDDIIVTRDVNGSGQQPLHFSMLRQQWERPGQKDFRSLADYIAPVGSGRQDYLGAFAVTTGIGCEELASRYEKEFHDDYTSIMIKALADRLAEAFAEYLHREARRDWSYGLNEALSSDQLIEEKYRGIRPAHGYPACPDHTEKTKLFELLDAEKATGIKLTESFAMFPAASVCGLYFAHPESRYFSVDKVTKDQIEDYARRKHMDIRTLERWLSPNLGYDT
jgi:5-methyltetrahydrofolate--homocysteine methyltransferase